MIKIKMGQILSIVQSFENIGKMQIIPINLSYKIAKLLKERLYQESNIYKEMMSKVINTYCNRDENNHIIYDEKGYQIKEEFMNECHQKVSEINNIDIELDFESISMKELNEYYQKITGIKAEMPFIPNDMYALSDFFRE